MIHQLEPQLTFDAAAHSYFWNGDRLPGVTEVLQRGNLINYDFLNAQDRARYLDRGRRVHAATHDDDLGRLCESAVDAEIWGYLLGWRKFRSDYGFRPRLLEHRVCNLQYKFAGTLDRVGSVRDGSEIIADLKTGTVPYAVRYQLSAYASCLQHPRKWQRRAVELHSDGGYRVIGYEPRDYQRDFDTFLKALEEFRTKEEK